VVLLGLKQAIFFKTTYSRF